MTDLKITVIGKDLFKLIEEKFELASFNTVNQVNRGMLGNLNTLTYTFELEDDEIIQKRKDLLRLVYEDRLRMMAMFSASDWMRLYIMKPLKELAN